MRYNYGCVTYYFCMRYNYYECVTIIDLCLGLYLNGSDLGGDGLDGSSLGGGSLDDNYYLCVTCVPCVSYSSQLTIGAYNNHGYAHTTY